MAYFDEFARICFLNDSRKQAHRKAIDAQKDYEECCSVLAKEKANLLGFFESLDSEDDKTLEKE